MIRDDGVIKFMIAMSMPMNLGSQQGLLGQSGIPLAIWVAEQIYLEQDSVASFEFGPGPHVFFPKLPWRVWAADSGLPSAEI